jgi:histidine triad (HIT) family protein
MCIFCKIINKEIPCFKVHEDDVVLAFLDIAPINKGHILVVPKKHFSSLEEISEDVLKSMILVIKKIGGLLKEKMSIDGYNVVVNNGLVAGQEVDHLHFHIIPRSTDDGHKTWLRKKYQDGEAEKILEILKK